MRLEVGRKKPDEKGAFQVAVKSGYFSPPLAKRSDQRSETRVERGFDTWR